MTLDRLSVLAWLGLLAASCGGRTGLLGESFLSDAAAGANAAGSGSATGGNYTASGSTLTGGTTSIGSSTSTRGNATGGNATGGNATGGNATGGNATGGNATGGNATGGNATGGSATGGSATGGCPGNGGPAMVLVPEGYCIDCTEVTRDQYAAWLTTTTAVTIQEQPAADCSWNTTFFPDNNCEKGSIVCQGSNCGNHPQCCVDWCDAQAYCTGIGKRLCGKIGGGSNSYADYANEALSQWYNACTSHDPTLNVFPYGTNYDAGACNGYEYNRTNTTVAAGTLKGCQSHTLGYAGIFDLSGNVWEWEDSCNGIGQSALCRLHGGSFRPNPTSDNLRCDSIYAGVDFTRSSFGSFVGFRCCSP